MHPAFWGRKTWTIVAHKREISITTSGFSQPSGGTRRATLGDRAKLTDGDARGGKGAQVGCQRCVSRAASDCVVAAGSRARRRQSTSRIKVNGSCPWRSQDAIKLNRGIGRRKAQAAFLRLDWRSPSTESLAALGILPGLQQDLLDMAVCLAEFCAMVTRWAWASQSPGPWLAVLVYDAATMEQIGDLEVAHAAVMVQG
jgi:hypothetical protein